MDSMHILVWKIFSSTEWSSWPSVSLKMWCSPGRPPVPLIFVLAAEILQAAINDVVRRQRIRQPINENNTTYFLVIQYADDTFIIMPACPLQAAQMKKILTDYADSIGFRINFQKSTIVPINTAQDLTQRIASIFGCSTMTMPFTYLGLPLGTTRPSVQDLTPLVCSAERKITAAMLLMSYAGNLALANSLVTSLAIFSMEKIRLPPKIVE